MNPAQAGRGVFSALGLTALLIKKGEVMFNDFDTYDIGGLIIFLGMGSWFVLEWIKSDRIKTLKKGAELGRNSLQQQIDDRKAREAAQAPKECLDVLGGLKMEDAFIGEDYNQVYAMVGHALHTGQDSDFREAIKAIRRSTLSLNSYPCQKERLNALLKLYGIEPLA